MAEKNKKNSKRAASEDNIIFYPEFIPSVFSWVSLEDQKERAAYLEEVGNKDKGGKRSNNLDNENLV